ncbi:ThiF family adenylyltransferase [Ensifer adhaerens]|uniref:ThiF family adenylyltransferase n=1 Tax=Ensifer adhaerens TaxID=106592 RepID=UPI0009EB6F85|nr:ThiF family adenylyltransferase [Ensifer adhaerens]
MALHLSSSQRCALLRHSRSSRIGLGNLGQAYAWAKASLDFGGAEKARLMLQDIDRIAASNYSTSLLSFPKDVGTKKARVMARWLEERGFDTMLEERLFGDWSRRTMLEPGVALCGVDNAEARCALDSAGFGLVVEAGLDSFQKHRCPYVSRIEKRRPYLGTANRPVESVLSGCAGI